MSPLVFASRCVELHPGFHLMRARCQPALLLALVLGTAALTLLGVIGAALTEGARGGSGLMAVLVLPLAMPVLIFGALASTPADGGGVTPHLMLLGAVLAVLLAVAPFIAAAALSETESESGA